MTYRRAWRVLLGTLLALAVFAPPPAVAVGTPVQLSATVTNTDGVPQDGTICLELVGVGSCGGTYLTDGTWNYEWVDVADDPENGQTAGDYLIQVSSSTMDGTSRWYVAGNTAGTTVKGDATPVALSGAASDFSFTMVMPAIATVTGKVVNTSDVGVAGLPVLINEGGQVRSTTSGVGGAFDLGYTRAGAWRIHVNPGTSPYAGTLTDVVVPTSGALVVPDLTVQLPATVEGVVTDSVTGDPLPFIDVTAWTAGSTDPSYLNSTTSDATGHYVIDGLGDVPLVLRFTDSQYNGYVRTLNDDGDPVDWNPQTAITLAESEHLVLPQQLVAKAPPTPPTHTLSGTVTDTDGLPLAGIDVSFDGQVDDTDRLGHWYLDTPDGTHTLSFAAGAGWSAVTPGGSGWVPEDYPSPVTVASDVTDGLDVVLARELPNVTPPAIVGTPASGRTLTATIGSWLAPIESTFAKTWLRDGVVVGSGASYLVKPADAGRTLRVRVVATYGTTTSQAVLSAARTVARLASTVTASGRSPRAGRVKIRVLVSALGLTPTGTLLVKRGTRIVKRGVVLVDGAAVITLRRQPSGIRRYTVVYSGSTQVLPRASARLRIRVR
jgi:hypothetical protein